MQAFFKGLYRALAEQKIARSELLCTFEGELFDQQVQRYKELTAEFQELSKKMLYARLSNQLPYVYEDIDNSSEIGRLNRNIANGGEVLQFGSCWMISLTFYRASALVC